jgi:antitoxin (DNA-binding transcriptional repressor) of toxin-antitoxin stability system
MVQQGQTIELTRRGPGGERLWAYRYRTGGRGSKRVQRGGFASEQDKDSDHRQTSKPWSEPADNDIALIAL